MTYDVSFPKHVRPLPPGYRVVQLDSGHLQWIGPLDAQLGREAESVINVDRWATWRGAFAHAAQHTPHERPILYSAPMVLAKLAGRKTQTRRVAKFKFYDGQNPSFPGYTPGTYMTGGTPGTWVLRSRGGGGCWNDRTEPLDCPYGNPGGRLWGRETFAVCEAPILRGKYQYRADGAVGARIDDGGEWRWVRYGYTVGAWKGDDIGRWVGPPSKWKPSIFMPRAASRILDEVVSVRVERLQDISEADALAEGMTSTSRRQGETARAEYAALWETLRPTHSKGPRVTSPNGFVDAAGNDAGEWVSAFSWAANPWVWRIETKPVTP